MSAEPAEPYGIIPPHDEPVAMVPLHKLRVLEALEAAATPEALDEAEMKAAIEEHEAWKAAGRPGEMSHEEFMAEMFGDAR